MDTQVLRIGDVSRMLHISDQMIRYYEKNGVIKPERSTEGNYRTYSMEDVFLLFEAMRYKEWDMNISDINDVIHGDYFSTLSAKLSLFAEKLGKEIESRSLLQTRISALNRKLKLCRYNIGKYFVFEQPSYHLFFCGTSHGDQYDVSVLPEYMTSQIFNNRNISFFDVWVEFHSQELLWWYALEDRYNQKLHLQELGEKKRTPCQLCLSTFIDMGEMGDFSEKAIEPAFSYIKENGYSITGIPRGLIIGRGYTANGTFSRIMELQIPISM